LIQFAPNFFSDQPSQAIYRLGNFLCSNLEIRLAAYQEIVGEQPAMGLTLQYVNNLQIPTVEQTCRYEDYLNFKPSFGETASPGPRSLFYVSVLSIESARDWLKVE